MFTDNQADPDALTRAAQTLEAMAKDLRKRAQGIVNSRKREAKLALKFGGYKSAGQLCANRAGYQKSGLENAAKIIAKNTGIPQPTLEHYAKIDIQNKKTREKLARDREINRLAARGFTNPEIATQFKISTRTVTRAIAAAYREDQAPQ